MKNVIKTMIVFAVMLFAVSAQATKWGGHVITGSVSGYGNAASMAGGSAGVVTSTESLAGASANLMTKGVIMSPNSKTNYTGSAGFSTFGTAATSGVVGNSNTFAHTLGGGGFKIVLPNMHHHW